MPDLLEEHIDLICKKLPTHLAVKYHKYPHTVCDAAEHIDYAQLKQENITNETRIAIFYSEEAEEPGLVVRGGEIIAFDPESFNASSPVVRVHVGGEPAYIEIENDVFLNRMENIQLPLVLANPSELVTGLLAKQSK
jgi:hypothetical protein